MMAVRKDTLILAKKTSSGPVKCSVVILPGKLFTKGSFKKLMTLSEKIKTKKNKNVTAKSDEIRRCRSSQICDKRDSFFTLVCNTVSFFY